MEQVKCRMAVQDTQTEPRKKVAIVGGGIAGLAALWVLKRSPHDVYIYDADSRLGGHTCTVEFVRGKFKTMVDVGFMVMNSETYPSFIGFLDQLGIETVPAPMTFSVSRDQGRFEWAGTSLNTLFCQRKNLFSLRMWRMIFDTVRFNLFAPDVLARDEPSEETIGDFLEREGYSEAFRDDYLIPMTAAIWSTSPDKRTLDFPAVTLIRFLWNHHLLSTLAKRPDWLTIADGSQTYIDKLLSGFPPDHTRLSTAVTSLNNDADGRVRVHAQDGTSDVFDHVILATHGDQACALIRASATPAELSILQHFRTTENTVVLHADTSLLPRSRSAWSSWNYLAAGQAPPDAANNPKYQEKVCVTYSLNHLQHIPLPAFGPVLATLNPVREPDPATVQGRFIFRHPLYTPAAVRAQQRLRDIQDRRGISYAGAWTGYGFHEDGFVSGVEAAREFLARCGDGDEDRGGGNEHATWGLKRERRVVLTWGDWVVRLVIVLVQWAVVEGLVKLTGVVMEWLRGSGRLGGETVRNSTEGMHEKED
ncbi:hypothetical protein VTI74DRAFT_9449 [Chaetomium olivicolor]